MSEKCQQRKSTILQRYLFLAAGNLGDARSSTGEAVTEHWQTALRLRASRLILQNVPVFGQHPVGNTHDVGGDPVSWESNARESPVDDDKVAFGHDQARLIFEGCGRGLDEVEETFAAGFDVRAVLDVLIGPEAGCSIVVTFVEQACRMLRARGSCFARVWS